MFRKPNIIINVPAPQTYVQTLPALAAPPTTDTAMSRPKPLDVNGDGPICGAVGELLKGLSADSALKIKYSVTAGTQEFEVSRTSLQPPPRAENELRNEVYDLRQTVEALTRRVERTRRTHRVKRSIANDYLGTPLGPLAIDGKPGFVFRDAAGRYAAYRITENGFEYAHEVQPNERDS